MRARADRWIVGLGLALGLMALPMAMSCGPKLIASVTPAYGSVVTTFSYSTTGKRPSGIPLASSCCTLPSWRNSRPALWPALV